MWVGVQVGKITRSGDGDYPVGVRIRLAAQYAHGINLNRSPFTRFASFREEMSMSDHDFIQDLVTQTVMSRRSFIKWSAAVGGTAALLAGGFELEQALAATREVVPTADSIIWSACVVNCGSRCPLRLSVKDGIPSSASTRITPAPTPSTRRSALVRARPLGAPAHLHPPTG